MANLKDSNKQIGLSAQVDTQAVAGESSAVIGEATGDFPGKKVEEGTGRSALMVGAGILISRIIGVIRQRVFAHYLGTSDAAGAFQAVYQRHRWSNTARVYGSLSGYQSVD